MFKFKGKKSEELDAVEAESESIDDNASEDAGESVEESVEVEASVSEGTVADDSDSEGEVAQNSEEDVEDAGNPNSEEDVGESSEESDKANDSDGDETDIVDVIKKSKLKLVDSSYTRKLPLSILAGIAGAVVSLVLLSMFSYYANTVFFPLFVIGPLLMYFFNTLFRGGRDIRTLIIFIVLSLLFDYTTELAGRAALFAFAYPDYNLFNIPRMVADAFGLPEAFSKSATDNVFPLIFTALGVLLSWELLRAGRIKESAAFAEPDDGDDDEDDESEAGEDDSADIGDYLEADKDESESEAKEAEPEAVSDDLEDEEGEAESANNEPEDEESESKALNCEPEEKE